ncbi:MAG: hypothetical protein ACLFQK_09275 [Fibrobacterota bacterium]
MADTKMLQSALLKTVKSELIERGHYIEAAHRIMKILKENPENPEGYHLLTDIMIRIAVRNS